MNHWDFPFYRRFKLSPLQGLYFLNEFHSQFLACLHISISHVSLGITQTLIPQIFLLDFIKIFLCVSFKLLKFFDEIYDYTGNYCTHRGSCEYRMGSKYEKKIGPQIQSFTMHSRSCRPRFVTVSNPR